MEIDTASIHLPLMARFAIVNAAGQRLIDERMLNAVLVQVIVTSVVGPILTARYLHKVEITSSGAR